MNTETFERPGVARDGGFYAGHIRLDDGQAFALIVAPKSTGEYKSTIWIPDYKDVPGAKSFNDGLANTRAMAEEGSELAQWALNLRMDGHEDWYIPSMDELEVIYRNLKPSTEKNSCWARSGINLSSIVPSRPYTPEFPLQTQAELFKSGAEQTFESSLYWSSSQHIEDGNYAWCQDFYDGYQGYGNTGNELRARAVRRLAIL
ncbi:MAG: DUF1566 domain-containing protein [Pseudomonadota bacterium]|nr:DUF1566 domain-containing protein [Pseudomonadota bacterium]